MEKEVSLHQLQVKYIPEEDRMILRINTSKDELLEYYITRRYLKILWTPLGQVLLGDPNFKAYDSESKKAVFAFEHEKKMLSGITSKPFVEKKKEVKKVEPPTLATVPEDKPQFLLFTMAQVLTLADSSQALKLCDQQGRGLTLDCNTPALHFLYRLLLSTEPTTGWDLQLQPIDTFKSEDKPITH